MLFKQVHGKKNSLCLPLTAVKHNIFYNPTIHNCPYPSIGLLPFIHVLGIIYEWAAETFTNHYNMYNWTVVHTHIYLCVYDYKHSFFGHNKNLRTIQ